MNLLEHAKSELKHIHIDLDLDKDTYAYKLGQDTYNIIEHISDQKHSYESVTELMVLLNQLVFGKALSVITGSDDEWNKLDDNLLINNRDSRITKNIETGKIYFHDAYHFYSPHDTSLFTCNESKKEIHLPIYQRRRKTPSFSYGDIRYVNPIYKYRWTSGNLRLGKSCKSFQLRLECSGC